MGDKSKIEWTDATWNPVVGAGPWLRGKPAKKPKRKPKRSKKAPAKPAAEQLDLIAGAGA